MSLSIGQRLARTVNAEPGELRPALAGFVLFLSLFSGYFMLRPLRETMGVQAGVQNLQWLFTATFVVMLMAVPLFAWLNSKVPRIYFIDWVYGFFLLNLALFAAVFAGKYGGSLWVARVFYVWISVYNLFVVSVAWSLMADVFDAPQAKRLFAFIAAGASVGGLLGPALSTLLIGALGQSGLVLLAAVLLGVAIALKHYLMHWRELGGAGRPGAVAAESTRRPVQGNPFSGLTKVFGSPYLLGIAAFIILLSASTTFLYFEQARLVGQLFHSRDEQTRIFSIIDFVVQAGSLAAQLFITGRIAEKLGVRVLLTAVPLLVALGFVALALSPTFAVLATAMVVRRIGEYAFIRPGREMLWAPMDAETKYKAKNFIDTVVYRAGDTLTGWASKFLNSLGHGAVAAALAGAVCAILWAALGWYLGKRADNQGQQPAQSAQPAAIKGH